MADTLNITLAPQLELIVTHDMGGVASGFTIVAGISRSTGGGAGNEYTNQEKVKLAGIETAATADQTGAEIKTLYELEADTNAFDDAAVAKLATIEASATADQSDAEIRTAVEAALDSNVFTDADHSKLNAIEDSATADQTNAEIRAAIEAATDSNVFTDADHTKLNAIESGATGDQTNAEIRTAVEAAIDSNVFTDADHTKLNAIEASATADQTGAEIKTLYELEADTNAFNDAALSKLAGIETGATADQSDAEIETAYNNRVPQINATEIGEGIESTIRRLAPDDIVAMVNAHAPAAIDSAHYADPLADIPALVALSEASLSDKERRYVESEVSDYFYDQDAVSGDQAPTDQSGGTGWWITVTAGGKDSASQVKAKYERNANTNEFNDAEKAKLGGIEASATADQTDAEIRAAVEAATDSNVFTDADHTKLAAIEANATADLTGAEIKALYEVELNAFTDTKNTKLAGLEANATADQSDAEIRAAVEAATDSNVFTDADHSKLNAIEASATADQSDAEIATAYGNEVAQVSGGEITAGTEVGLRTYSPADVVAIVTTHGTGADATAVNSQVGTAYTLALTDAEDIVEMNNGAANVLTIPTNAAVAFPVGTVISVSMMGAGVTTITADTGVTLNGVSAGSGALTGQYAGVSMYKRATDIWVAQGAIEVVA